MSGRRAVLLLAIMLLAAGAGPVGARIGEGESEVLPGANFRGDGRRQAIPTARISDCGTLSRLSERLGETHAGQILRATLIETACGPLEARRVGESTWIWPWAAGGGIAERAPPLLVASFGAWHVRCSVLVGRRRCTLMHRAARETGPSMATMSTHFVLDRIAGRESLLWRIYVPARRVPPTLPLSLQAGGEAAAPADKLHSAVAFDTPGVVRSQHMTACDAVGCMVETSVRDATVTATRLLDGHAIEIRLNEAGVGSYLERLPSEGFREGLDALARARREEDAGRRSR